MLPAVRLMPLLLLPLVAGQTPDPARDKRNLHYIFRGLADAFGYDIRLKNATAGGIGPPPPPPTDATTPLPFTPKVTEETTQGYTGTTATDSEFVPPFKFQGGRSESDDEIFDGARPTESYRPSTSSSAYHGDDRGSSESKDVPRGEQEERSNRPPDSDGPNKEFGGYPSNFGSPYGSSYDGYPPSFHGNDPYHGSSSECRGCSETEEQKNEKIFTNTDEHSAHVPPPYSTPNWEGFWDAGASQGKDTHVGYNDYHNTPTESVEQHTDAVYPREEENYVTSKEDTYENLKYKQSKQTAPSHSDFRITIPEEAYSRETELTRPTSNDRGNRTQSASDDIIHTTLPTHAHSVHGKVYSEQLPVISTFKPKLLHALEEVEGSKQNVYVPPPFDDSFESTDSLSVSKFPKVLSTTPLTYSSTSARSAETSLADITQHLTYQDKVSAQAAGSNSPWHPPEEHLKPNESQDKKYQPDDPHYPRPFTYTQAIFHDQPSNNKIVNTSETSTSTTPYSSTNAYRAPFVPLDSAESKGSLDTTTKSADGYLEDSRNRKFDYSSPHSSAYRYNNDYEKPLADHAHTYSFSPTYTPIKFYKNSGNDSVTKDSVPQNSSSYNFVAERPQNYSAFPSFSYSELERTPAHSYTPEHSTSEEYSAPNNEQLARTQQHSNQHPDNYTHTPYSRLENSSHVNPREIGSGNKYDGTASELVSASKHPLESPHQSESNTQTTKSDTLPSVSTVESSTIHEPHSDKYSKLETFSSEVPNESSSSKNSSEPYRENLKTESNLNLYASQQSNSPNVSDPTSRVSEHHKVPSGSPYQFNYNEPLYHYSKLSIPPSVIPLHYPYEESVNYPSKGKQTFGYHGESNHQFPSYTSPDRVPSASGFKDSEEYYIPSPSKVYDPYVYSEDFHRPNWEKLNNYYFSHHPEATNNTYTARTIPQRSYFGSSFYPSLESYSGPQKITSGSDHEKPPQNSQSGATTARQSQPDEASRDGKSAEGAGEESRATARDGSQGQQSAQQGTTKGHLQRHPSFSADSPGQVHASSEVFYEDQAARTSAPSREELHYSSQTIPSPTAYQPLERLEHANFWEQDERRPENLKVTEWESSVSTLSVMSTSTSYPETAYKKKSS